MRILFTLISLLIFTTNYAQTNNQGDILETDVEIFIKVLGIPVGGSTTITAYTYNSDSKKAEYLFQMPIPYSTFWHDFGLDTNGDTKCGEALPHNEDYSTGKFSMKLADSCSYYLKIGTLYYFLETGWSACGGTIGCNGVPIQNGDALVTIDLNTGDPIISHIPGSVGEIEDHILGLNIYNITAVNLETEQNIGNTPGNGIFKFDTQNSSSTTIGEILNFPFTGIVPNYTNVFIKEQPGHLNSNYFISWDSTNYSYIYSLNTLNSNNIKRSFRTPKSPATLSVTIDGQQMPVSINPVTETRHIE